MIDAPSWHTIGAMAVTVAMFVAFARGRVSTEIVSLLTIATIAVGLYFLPLPNTRPTDGLALAFSGFGHPALITICALMITRPSFATTPRGNVSRAPPPAAGCCTRSRPRSRRRARS